MRRNVPLCSFARPFLVLVNIECYLFLVIVCRSSKVPVGSTFL